MSKLCLSVIGPPCLLLSPDHKPIFLALQLEAPFSNLNIKGIQESVVCKINIDGLKGSQATLLTQKLFQMTQTKHWTDMCHQLTSSTLTTTELSLLYSTRIVNPVFQIAQKVLGTTETVLNGPLKITIPKSVLGLTICLNRLQKVILAWKQMISSGKLATSVAKLALNKIPWRVEPLKSLQNSNEVTLWIEKVKAKYHTLQKKISQVLKKETNARIRIAIAKIHKLHQVNPKMFFQKANFAKQQTHKGLISVKKTSSNSVIIITDPNEVKEEVALFWESVFSNKVDIQQLETQPWMQTTKVKELAASISQSQNQLDLQKCFTESDVWLAIKSFPKKKSAGPDLLPIDIFKVSPPELISGITQFMNSCLKIHDIPDEWRKCNIFTIYKKGDSLQPSNYRPIALLNCLYKVFTALLTVRISDLMEKINGFSEEQRGFRKGKNTMQKILTAANVFQHSKTTKSPIHIMYLDIQKAYDSVEHKALVETLHILGFDNHITSLIANIYSKNIASIITPYGLSRQVQIKCGVRQGCPMSPLMFILFLEPLIHWINSKNEGYKIQDKQLKILAYADDIMLLSNSVTDLQRMLDQVCDFLTFYGMSLNTQGHDKTVYTSNSLALQHLFITSYDQNRNLQKTIVPYIPQDSCYKYLGVYISLTLDWKKQMAICSAKLIKQVTFLQQKCLTVSQTIEIVNKVFIPSLRYSMNFTDFPPEVDCIS